MDEASKRAVAAESLDDAAALIEAMRSKDGPGIAATIQFTTNPRLMLLAFSIVARNMIGNAKEPLAMEAAAELARMRDSGAFWFPDGWGL